MEYPCKRSHKQTICINFDVGFAVSVAEIVHFYLPRMIDLHNYVNANSTSQKRINWNMLNRKVFVKLNLKLNDKIIENVIEAKPGAIEQVVWDLRKKISEVSPKSITRSNTSSHIQKGKSSIPVVGINKLGKKVPSEAVTSAQSARIPAKPQQSLGGKLASVPSGSKGAERPQQDGSSYTAGLKDELYQFGRNVSNSAGVEGGERPRVSESVSAGSGVDVNANNPDSPSLPPAHLIYKGHKMVPSMLLEVKNKQIRDLQLVVNGLQKKVCA